MQRQNISQQAYFLHPQYPQYMQITPMLVKKMIDISFKILEIRKFDDEGFEEAYCDDKENYQNSGNNGN